MKPRPRLTRPPMNIDHSSPPSPSPSSLASTLEYQRKQVYLGAAVAAQQQQQLQQHLSQQQNKQIKSVQKSIMSHQRNNNDRGINNHFINNSNNNTNNNNVLTKHQQLHHLLKSNDNINNNQNRNLNPSTRSQFALSCKNINWPQGSIPTSQAPPSMPTSLLNLAACSSSNQTASPNIGSSSSARSRNIIHSRVNSNSNTVSGNMPATRSSSLMRNSNIVPRNRNQSSLLQDEASKSSKLNNASNLSVIHHTNKPTAKPAQASPAQVGPKRLSSRSNVKSDLNQSHNLGSQSVTIELVSSSHASDVQQTSTKIDHQEKDLDYLACTRTADDSVLQPPVSLGNKSRKHVNAYATGMLSDSDQLTNEVKSLVLEECNIIYECKSCSNLFRSLPNFVKHKRSFCHERSMILEEGTKSRSMASLLSVDPSQNLKSDDKISSEQTNDDHDSSLEPNSAIVDFRPLDYENGNTVTHTYNSRGPGKRYNLAHELRMLRLLHNHDRKAQQQKEAARQKERSLIANETIPVETSLSKLLQSQPKARLPASQDKALIEALTIATATSPPVSSIEQRNPNLDIITTKESNRITSRRASSILSTKSIISVEQDNIAHKGAAVELNSDSIHQTKQAQGITRKMAPKRKFLEDCIQKVKRDKKLVEEEDQSVNVQLTSIDSNSNAVLQTTSINEQVEQSDSVKERLCASSDISELPLKADSGTNSHLDSDSDDMLTIDLGGIDIIKKKAQPPKSRRRSTNTTNPKVSSSALLKALTRPVLEQNQTVRDISSTSSANDLIKQVISNPTTEDTHSDKGDSLPIDIKMTCDICNIDFVDSQSLVQHNETKHLIEKVVYPCIFCSMSFTLLENACRHIIEIHKKPRTQLHRLKDVVKFRSHLTNDFSACEDYVPSKNPAATYGEELSNPVFTTITSNESIEHVSRKQEESLSLSEQTKAGDISESIPLVESETSITESDEATTKEKNIDVVVDDIVNQVVDDHLIVEDQNATTNSSEAEDIITTKEFDTKPEVRSEPVALSGLIGSEKDSVIDKQVQNVRIEDQDNEVENPVCYHEQLTDSSEDSGHCGNKVKQKPSKAKKITPEINLTDETQCASAPPSDISTNSEYDSRSFKDGSSSLEKEVKEVLACDITAGDYHLAPCEESKKQQQKIEQEISRTDDKRDSKIITHESSSKKHHSKEEIRHTKSHDKNKSRSRSSSTEHVRSDERSHHKSSSNHHTSSAKKKHQSKAEQKTSPVPSAEPIMKLKIQLKTRPDEKCKVYEIV